MDVVSWSTAELAYCRGLAIPFAGFSRADAKLIVPIALHRVTADLQPHSPGPPSPGPKAEPPLWALIAIVGGVFLLVSAWSGLLLQFIAAVAAAGWYAGIALVGFSLVIGMGARQREVQELESRRWEDGLGALVEGLTNALFGGGSERQARRETRRSLADMVVWTGYKIAGNSFGVGVLGVSLSYVLPAAAPFLISASAWLGGGACVAGVIGAAVHERALLDGQRSLSVGERPEPVVEPPALIPPDTDPADLDARITHYAVSHRVKDNSSLGMLLRCDVEIIEEWHKQLWLAISILDAEGNTVPLMQSTAGADKVRFRSGLDVEMVPEEATFIWFIDGRPHREACECFVPYSCLDLAGHGPEVFVDCDIWENPEDDSPVASVRIASEWPRDVLEREPRRVVDDYEVLELPAGASVADIKAAYRRMAQKYHPDKVTDDQDFRALAHAKFLRIREAYERLIQTKE